MHGALGHVHLQCTQRVQAPQHFFIGGGTLLGQNIDSPGKASEIPGMHGKRREIRKKSQEIPGHFSSIYIYIITAIFDL